MQSYLQLVEATDAPTDGWSQDLITLEDLKLELGITGTDEDELLAARITRVSRMIAEACDRVFHFSEAIETFVFDRWQVTQWNQPLSLKLYPVNVVESIALDGAALDESYIVDTENGRVWRSDAAWSGTVVVTYSGGYVLPDNAPSGLQMAAIEWIRERRLAVTEGGGGAIQSTVHGDTRVTYFQASSASSSTASSTGLPLTVQNLIAPFKRLTV
jgi:hypothetical protein